MSPAATPAPAYKRSWKNLLLNKRYQLRFTLFMVGVSAILMSGLGVWVMKEANEATTVAMIRVRGNACEKVPAVVEIPQEPAEPAAPMDLDAKPGSAAPVAPPEADSKPATPAAPSADDITTVKAMWCVDAECTPEAAMPLNIKAKACDEYVTEKFDDAEAIDALKAAKIPVVKCEGGESRSVADATPHRRVAVQLEESSITMVAPPPPKLPEKFADRIVEHHRCEMEQAGAIDLLENGRERILWVLVGTGILLMLGLAVYGIKMTHKVAGPLFKVQLYLAKMREGRYDKVWNLRKGDQLIDFYEHFKSAHAGVVTMEKDDIERVKTTIAAAKDAGLGDHETVKELESLVARKEKALE